jgi:hypothetical protein
MASHQPLPPGIRLKSGSASKALQPAGDLLERYSGRKNIVSAIRLQAVGLT